MRGIMYDKKTGSVLMYDKIILDNGLCIIGERMEHFRSVSVGVWIGAGSQYESPAENGLSHFLEHMLFKGTERRSARDIADQTDAVGAQLNAFTAKECTCYYIKVIDEHIELALDMLSDMVLNSKLDSVELDKEKGVILEEIGMTEDSPEDVVFEMLASALYGDHPLGMSILGPADNIRRFDREDLCRYRARMYRPNNTVLALAGNYDWERVIELAKRMFGGWQAGGENAPSSRCRLHYDVQRREKDIEQVQICLGMKGVEMGSKDVYALSIFNNLFGGAASSRLFQRIREEQGLAYSVYSYPSNYKSCGALAIYAGTGADNAQSVLRSLRDEMDRALDKGVSAREFEQAREHLKGSYILGLESASSHMSSLGRRMLLMGDTMDEDQVISRINEVTLDDVNRVMRDSLSGDCAIALMGKGVNALDLSMFGK